MAGYVAWLAQHGRSVARLSEEFRYREAQGRDGRERAFSREEIEQLKEPFDPRVVQWVVTASAGGEDGDRRGLLAAYAEPAAVHGPVE